MKPIEELLQNLARPEVLEFGLVTNRLPSVNVGGRFEPVDDEAPTTDKLLEMLVEMGGSRHVEALSDKPVQWTTRLPGVGVIAVAAIMRRDVVQARFTVARREGAAGRPSAGPPGVGSIPAPRPSAPAPSPGAPAQRPSGRTSVAPPQPPPPPSAARLASVPPIARSVPPARPSAPSPAAPQVASTPPRPPASAPAVVVPPPPSEEWDDDDEPTVQTSSPPVAVPARAGQDVPRPKPARRPEEVPSEPKPPRPPAPSSPSLTLASPVSSTAPSAAPAVAVPPVSASAAPPASQAGALPRDTARHLGQFATEAAQAAVETDEEVAESRPPPRASQPVRAADKASEATEPSVAKDAPESAIASSRGPRRRPTPTRVDAVAPEEEAFAKAAPMPVAAKKVEGDLESLPSVLAAAVAARATDVHLVTGRPVLLRIGSDLVARSRSLSSEAVEQMIEELLSPVLRAELDAEGAAETTFVHDEHGRFRARGSRHFGGKRVLLRVIPHEVPTLASLAVPEPVGALARAPRGLVVVAAPTGHGKTSTLAAFVDAMNAEGARRIVVVESHAEHVHPRNKALVTQHQVGVDVATAEEGASLAARADADAVVLDVAPSAGALRAAIELAEAGKLVLLGVPCAGASRAVDRILDSFSADERASVAERLARVLRGVVGQRLVPSADRARVHAAFELVPTSLALYAAVREGRPGAVAALLARGRQPGGIKLEDALGDLVRSQKTTLEVARAFADHARDVEGGTVSASRKR